MTPSGPAAGRSPITAVVDGRPTTVREGTIHAFLDALHFTGRAVARGAGPYAGQRLSPDYRERPATPEPPDPAVFDLAGVIARRR